MRNGDFHPSRISGIRDEAAPTPPCAAGRGCYDHRCALEIRANFHQSQILRGGIMNAIMSRITGSRATKGAVVGVMAAAAISLAAPLSSASAQSEWTYGCRGYWYTTSGHGYCSKSLQGTPSTSGKYQVTYDCNNEIDTQRTKKLPWHYKGKFDSHECTFKINYTRVGLG